MSVFDPKFVIENDTVMKVTPVEWDNDGNLIIDRKEEVMDKETFIECYERWIKEREGKEG